MHQRRILWFILPVLLLGVALSDVDALLPAPAAQAWLPVEPGRRTRYLPYPGDGPSHTSHAVILYERSTGTVLFGENIHERRAPASLTKLMTAILAVEIGNLDDVVTVSNRAAGTRGSSAHLYAGQKIRLIDLLYGLLLNSGNDAAVAIAEHIAGSEEAFAEMMTRRAREMGLENTQFRNPHGLDAEGHYSTAYDLALLTDRAMSYPVLAEIMQTKEYQLNAQVRWRNTNRLLWQLEGVEGGKTGTTGQAGNCLITAVSDDGMQLVVVVLGSANRWNDSIRILEWGFDHFHRVTLVETGSVIAEIPYPTALGPLVAVARTPLTLIVPSDRPVNFHTSLHLHEVRPPVRRGDPIGELQVWVDEATEPLTIPLTAGGDVPRRTPLRLLWEWLRARF